MTWLVDLFTGGSIAQSLVALSLSVVLGLGFGHISLWGVRLGVGGVLFSSLTLAWAGIHVDGKILEFAREFGLVLFVFTVGMQVGPGFADSLRRRGLFLNLSALVVALLGVVVTVILFVSMDLPLPVAVGLLSGAVTNTPSLAAASQAFEELMPSVADAASSAGMGYAVAYPFGILGVILTMLLIRVSFRINPQQELQTLKQLDAIQHPPLEKRTFIVRNVNIFKMALLDFLKQYPVRIAISRVREADSAVVRAPGPGTILKEGMLVRAVGQESELEKLRILLGPTSEESLDNASADQLEIRRIRISERRAAGKTATSLGLTPEHGVTVTRIVRAGVEFSPDPGLPLHYGDTLTCAGSAGDLDRAAALAGNSIKALDHPHIVSLFIGLLCGVVLGSIPLPMPGITSSIKLGLAGGPLLAAIFLSRVNNFAGMIWYLPTGANLVLREIGIALFLACVGLNSGVKFFDTLINGSGLLWMGAGACITFIPLIIVAVGVRLLLRYDFASICGLLAGSMTDPPALAFSVTMLGSDKPSSIYASVYPLSMMLRIVFAQVLVIALLFLGG
ncbi:MAG: putative transporter [Desulfovibrio sp.]|jgi:putative transport protein|nr:putative transporter [Desulfovibrio sp.]